MLLSTSMPFCVSCGAEMKVGWKACPDCGIKVGGVSNTEARVPHSQPIVVMQNAPKSMGVALLLNFLIAGGGHMYLDHARGGVYAVLSVFCVLTFWLVIPVFLYFFLWLACMIMTPHAHRQYMSQKGFSPNQIVV